MFDEYTFLKDRIFDEYFGFTSEEVISLCEKNDEIEFSELENWYNGYLTIKGKKIYNPRSVVKALQNKHCEVIGQILELWMRWQSIWSITQWK